MFGGDIMSTSVFKARQASKRLDKLTITSVEHQKPYLFVSYKSDDWELAIEEIVYTLQKKFGLRIYYDRDFEDTNESWVVAMKTQMESPQCAGVLAFFSQNYVRSYATLLELLTSQQEMCAMNNQPKPIISVFLEEAMDVSMLCEKVKYRGNDLGNTGIKKPEWAALEACFQNFNLQKNHITPQIVKDACEEMEKLDNRFQDLSVRSVVSCFKSMDDVIAKNHKDYGGDRFFEMLKNTIQKVDNNRIAYLQSIGAPVQSIFDEMLIKPDDLNIPRTSSNTEYVKTEKVEEPEQKSEQPSVPEEASSPEEQEALSPVEDEASELKVAHTAQRRKSVTGDVRYSIYGKEYEENQSDMMLRVFAQVLMRHPECVDTLPEQAGMNCAAKKTDIVSPNTKDAKPSYFRVCREFTFDNGQRVCIGTAYASADKMKKIARLLEICGEDRSVFQSTQVELPDAPRQHGHPGASEEPQGKRTGRTKTEKNFFE